MQTELNSYNDFAAEYSEMVAQREEAGLEQDPIMPPFLAELGDVSGLLALDAGCGEGYLARLLSERGAEVIGIDVAPNLIQLAREKDPTGAIAYQVANLSQPLPAYQEHFDLIASHLVLNDVPDYRSFLTTLGSVLKPGGRLVFSMNNPYSYVVRNHITDYFGSDQAFPYRGMAEKGVKVRFYHRTLEEYLSACFAAGFRLQRLIDISTPEGTFKRRDDTLIPMGYHFPFFMLLSFVKG